MMSRIGLNIGTGPIKGATEAHAEINMRHLLTDCSAKDLEFVRVPQHDATMGRYHFLIYRETRCHLIEMPGLPLDQVRWMSEDKQNIGSFARLYVDGSSWAWKFALNCLTEEDFAAPTT
jgi:hypothetical protein